MVLRGAALLHPLYGGGTPCVCGSRVETLARAAPVTISGVHLAPACLLSMRVALPNSVLLLQNLPVCALPLLVAWTSLGRQLPCPDCECVCSAAWSGRCTASLMPCRCVAELLCLVARTASRQQALSAFALNTTCFSGNATCHCADRGMRSKCPQPCTAPILDGQPTPADLLSAL